MVSFFQTDCKGVFCHAKNKKKQVEAGQHGEELAKQYYDKGYDVDADLKDWYKPRIISGQTGS